MRLRRLLSGLLLLGLTLSIFGLVTPLARAADGDSQGIQVSPVIIDLNSEKGHEYTLKITVTNVTAGDLALTSSVNDFESDGDTGNPKVILEDRDSSYSLKTWVTVPSGFTLKSKESRQLTLTVNVPDNAEAGGHYGIIRFSGVPPGKEPGTVSLNASVGTLLLARVAGNITENLQIKSMNVQQKGKNKSVVNNGPVDIVTKVENTGNVHVKPVGTMTVKDMFGKVVGTFEFGSPTKNVLPHSTRTYTQRFDKKWMFGRYTVNVQAAYGTTGGVLMGSTSFWVIPFKLIIFIIVIVALLILLGRRLQKRYDKRVMRRVQQNKGK